MNKKWKILVTETIGELGINILKEAPDIELIQKKSLSKHELKLVIADVDGILTRSGTTMDEEIINAASTLKVIGRAGVGVDNIDIPAASRKGIIVINSPSGNTLAAVELTIGTMLSVVRKISQANASVRRGEWTRSKFTGCQLNGKNLLIIGLGRIGGNVATRCRAFGMDIIAYDPYITPKRADSLRVHLMSNLEDAIKIADIVTIHTPLTKETKNMINEETLKLFKPGAYLINCARGGIVDEKAVTEAVRNNNLNGFGTDVFSVEPLDSNHPFLDENIADRVLLTPHIGANTHEAQSEVSRIAVENMLSVLRGEPYIHAVNLPFIEQALTLEQKVYLNLARKIGVLAAKVAEVKGNAVHSVHIKMRGNIFDKEEGYTEQLMPYTISALKGLLEVSLGEEVSFMLAPILAKDRNINVVESTGEAQTYKNTIEIELETEKESILLIGTITEEGRQRIVRVNDYWIDFVPNGKILMFQNYDMPGVIGKIGTLLGESGVNIANFALGRKNESGHALGVLEIDGEVDDKLMSKLIKSGDLLWETTVDFSGDIK